MNHFFAEYKTCIILGAYWLLSSVADAQPQLPKNAGFWQTWVVNTIHLLAANFSRIQLNPRKAK